MAPLSGTIFEAADAVSYSPLLLDPPFVLALLLLAMALGRKVLGWMHTPLLTVTRLERLTLSGLIGAGVLQYPFLLLGCVGQLKPWTLAGALLLLAPLIGREIAASARELGAALCDRNRRLPFPFRAALVVLGLALAVGFLQALCPPTDPDGLAYHLTAPKRWLQAEALIYLPTLVHAQGPMGVETLFGLALALRSDTAAKLIHFAFGLGAVAATFALGSRVRSEKAGLAAAALFAIGPSACSAFHEISWAYIDLGVACATVCMALSWLLWRRTGEPGWLRAAVLCAGFAVTFKLTGVFTALALAVLYGLRQWKAAIPVRAALVSGLGLLCVALLPAAPWLLRSALLTGNPIYPALSGLFPTRDWSPETAAIFDQWFKYSNWSPQHPEFNLAARKTAHDHLCVGVALVAVVLWMRMRDAEKQDLLLLAALPTVAVLWITGPYLRFLLPIAPLAWVLLFMHTPRLRLRHAAFRMLAPFLAGAALFAVSQSDPDPRLALRNALGLVEREAYLTRRIPIFPIWSYVNRRLPPQATLLLVGFDSQYFSDRFCFVSDPIRQNRFRLDSWSHFQEDLRSNQVGYLLIPDDLADKPLRLRAGPDSVARRNEFPFATRLATTCGERLTAAGGVSLYRLHLERGRTGWDR